MWEIALIMPETSARHVLITGCSTGIGRTCATWLAMRGFVVFAGVRDPSTAPQAKNVIPLVADITDADSIRSASALIDATVGNDGLKGLFNNAGTGVLGPVECVSIPDWRRQFEVNFFGHIAITQGMLPLLRRHVESHGKGSARIINNTSIAGRVGQPIFGPYCASKFAMEGLSDSLRLELRGQGIRVSIIEPGPVKSEIWNKGKSQTVHFRAQSEQMRQLYAELVDGVEAVAMQAAASAVPAERVAEAVEKCLIARRPPTRILIGTDARVAAWFKSIAPTRLFDSVLLRMIRKAKR